MTNSTVIATAPTGLIRDLRSAEEDLQLLRGRLRKVAEFIHDPAFDLEARRALAQRLDLPAPSPVRRTAANGSGAKQAALTAAARQLKETSP